MKLERHHFRIETTKAAGLHASYNKTPVYIGTWNVIYKGGRILATFSEFDDADLFVNTYIATKNREWERSQPSKPYKPLPASAVISVSTVLR